MRNGTDGWKSLGGILLAFTGVEALFADLGAFSRRYAIFTPVSRNLANCAIYQGYSAVLALLCLSMSPPGVHWTGRLHQP